MMTTVRPRSLAVASTMVCAVFAATAVGCGDSSGKDPTAAAPTTVATTPASGSRYAAQLNELCAKLRSKVLEIYGGSGHHEPFPIKVFEAEQRRLRPVIDAFDAQADAIPVTAADRPAVDAFDAFRRVSDKAQARLAAAAATGNQDRFDAAIYEIRTMFEAGSTLEDLQAAGIVCNAR